MEHASDVAADSANQDLSTWSLLQDDEEAMKKKKKKGKGGKGKGKLPNYPKKWKWQSEHFKIAQQMSPEVWQWFKQLPLSMYSELCSIFYDMTYHSRIDLQQSLTSTPTWCMLACSPRKPRKASTTCRPKATLTPKWNQQPTETSQPPSTSLTLSSPPPRTPSARPSRWSDFSNQHQRLPCSCKFRTETASL